MIKTQSRFGNGILGLLLAPCLALLISFNSHADELAEKGRDIFTKNRQSVVTVQVVLKVTYSASGRSSGARESKQDLTGTVIDPSGLTVLSLSACDPSELYQRMMPEDYKLETEISDVKLLLEDGNEIAAEVVLRDKDLDLAFVRPKSKPTSPMSAIDLSKSATAQILDQLITVNRLNRAAGRAYAASVERISAVIQKPRTFYVPDVTATATSLGSPAFALNGNVVGLVVMRAVTAAGGNSANARDNLTSVIIPASDIVKAAAQAPEAKGGDEKKAEAADSQDSK